MHLLKLFLGLVFRPSSQKGFCAFCRAPRKYSSKKHLHVLDLLVMFLASGFFGSALWGLADPRSLVLFALLVAMGETFIYLRWRSRIVCRLCGFDPVLYNVSPSRAREKVRVFYEQKIKDPQFMLSRSPLLEVYRAQMESQRLQAKLQRVKLMETSVPELPILKAENSPSSSSL